MKNISNNTVYIIAIVFVAAVIFLARNNQAEYLQVGPSRVPINDKLTTEQALALYTKAERAGDTTQMYIQAAQVKAAYSRAGDKPNVGKWDSIKKQDELVGKVATSPL